MKKGGNWKTQVLVIGVLIGALASPSMVAAQEKMAVEDFRETLLDFLWEADAKNGGPTELTRLYDQINKLSIEEFDLLYSNLPESRASLRGMQKYLASPQTRSLGSFSDGSAQGEFGLFEKSHPAQTSFPPDYPSGGGYAVFTATLPGLGLLDFGPTNRTDGPALGDTYIVHHTSVGLGIAAQAGCDGGLLLAPALCATAAIAHGVTFATQIVIDQMAYQDGLIDGAEIEAAYENSKRIITQGNGINTDLANHATAISSQLTTHDTAIMNQVSVHDTNIVTLLAAHDVLINTNVDTHDTDIKALLSNLQGAVDENQRLIQILMARQLEVLRLLITASGQREINLDVLTCTGADCPEYPSIPMCKNGSLDWPCKQ